MKKYYNEMPKTFKKSVIKKNIKYSKDLKTKPPRTEETEKKICIHLFVLYDEETHEGPAIAKEVLASVLAPGDEEGIHRVMLMDDAMVIITELTDTPANVGHFYDALSSLTFNDSMKIAGVLVSPDAF